MNKFKLGQTVALKEDAEGRGEVTAARVTGMEMTIQQGREAVLYTVRSRARGELVEYENELCTIKEAVEVAKASLTKKLSFLNSVTVVGDEMYLNNKAVDMNV